MINEIKIDHTKPVLVWVWRNYEDKQKRIYLFTVRNIHFCVKKEDEYYFSKGQNYSIAQWDNIEFIKPKKLIPLDAKSCPRRPVLTHNVWGEGVEYYPSINEDGLYYDKVYTWKLLFEKGYMINGLPASREVDENRLNQCYQCSNRVDELSGSECLISGNSTSARLKADCKDFKQIKEV